VNVSTDETPTLKHTNTLHRTISDAIELLLVTPVDAVVGEGVLAYYVVSLILSYTCIDAGSAE
jgi:hypothetical protein